MSPVTNCNENPPSSATSDYGPLNPNVLMSGGLFIVVGNPASVAFVPCQLPNVLRLSTMDGTQLTQQERLPFLPGYRIQTMPVSVTAAQLLLMAARFAAQKE